MDAMKIFDFENNYRDTGRRTWIRWIAILFPLVVLVFLVIGNIQSFNTARTLSFQLTRNQSEAVAEELALRVALLVQKSSRSLSLLSNLWREASRENQRTTFVKWANGLMASDPIFDIILYLGADDIMIVTSPEGQRPLVGLDIKSRPPKEDLFKTLRKSISPLDAPPTAHVNSKGALVLWFPVLIRGDEAGTMAGALRLKTLLDSAVSFKIRNRFNIQISVSGREAFNSGKTGSNPAKEALKGVKNMSLIGMDLQVTAWPKKDDVYQKLLPSDLRRLTVMIILSIFVSGFLGVSLYAFFRIRSTLLSRQRLEKRYQTLFNAAIDGIMVMEPTGDILDANPALYASLGYTLVEMTGMNFSRILGKGSIGGFPKMMEQMQKKQPMTWEATLQTRQGGQIPVEMVARGIEYMEMPVVLVISRDISIRRQAMEALEESEARMKAIFEQAGVGIMQCGPDFSIQHANDKLCRILGYAREAVVGMNYMDFCFLEDRIETDTRLAQMENTDTATWEKRFRHKSGKSIWVRMTSSLIRSEAGKYLYSIDVVEDITRQHRLELQLRQAHKMESIGVLAGGIAHDFNNILGSILGFTQMALLDAPAGGRARERLEQVFKAANLATAGDSA